MVKELIAALSLMTRYIFAHSLRKTAHHSNDKVHSALRSRIIQLRAQTFILVGGALLLFTGCSSKSPAESLLSDYLQRLERVLEVQAPRLGYLSNPTLPARRDLRVEFESPSVEFLDYWAFRKCGLAPIIAERNSILGKVMVASENLLLDGRMILQLEYCLDFLEEQKDAEMIAITEQLLNQKYEQFPFYYWNATIASVEFRAFWSPTAEPLKIDRDEDFYSILSALQFLTDLPEALRQNRWPDREHLQNHFRQLEQYELGGRLLRSMQLSIQYIQTANAMLQDATTGKTLCPYELQKPELQYARNVMTKIYAGEVQVWFAKLNRYSVDLLYQLRLLVAQQPSQLVSRIAPFIREIDQFHEQFKHENRSHVDLWKKLFETCGDQALPNNVTLQ